MTSKPRHLHPLALVFFLYYSFKDLFFPIIIAILGITNLKAKNCTLLLFIVIALIIILITIGRYLKFTYQITNKEIIINSGIIEKKINHVPYDRIQNITTNQWFFLKPFNLTELEIETAGHAEKAEVELRAVPNALRQELDLLRSKNIKKQKNTDQVSLSNSYMIKWRDLLKFAFTSSTFLSGLLVVLAIYGKLQNVISKQIYQTAASKFSHLGFLIIIILILLILFIFYLGSVLVLISQYYHFKLTETDNKFETTRGLFQTKQTSISRKRIQAIIIKQTFLRNILHIATVQLMNISNSKKGDTEKDVVVMPVIRINELNQFMEKFFPDVPFETTPVHPLHWTYYYNLRNATFFTLLTLISIIWIFHNWLWVCAILSIVGIIIWYVPAILSCQRSQVNSPNENFLLLQNNRFMTKNLILIPKNAIQFIEKRTSIWLEQKNLSGLSVNVRAGNIQRKFKVSYLAKNDIDLVTKWYRK